MNTLYVQTNMSRAPIKHTCPDIDKCIKWLKAAQSLIGDTVNNLDIIINNDEISDDTYQSLCFAKQNLEEAFNLIDFEGMLEDLRDSNSTLRDWGYQLLDELEELE